MRWSSPLEFNDPFDNQFDLHIDCKEEVCQLTLEKLWERHCGNAAKFVLSRKKFDETHIRAVAAGIAELERSLPGMHQGIRQEARQRKILCLAQTATSILMWAYYAESHKGVALVIALPDGGQAVQYSECMPRLDKEALSDRLSGKADAIRKMAQRLVFTKSKDWAHECEWRFFAGTGRNPNKAYEDEPFNERDLKGVIFGCKTPQDDQRELSALVRERYPHAKLLKAVPHQREYSLHIQDC